MIISKTPLRISFAGGGSDLAAYYNSRPGAVASSTIDKYVYISVNKNNIFDDAIRVCYSKTEIVKSVEELEHNIIREALKIVGIEKGIEIIYMGDIPLGSAGIGLGSSSSLAVGVLNALYAFKGQHVSAGRLAREACKIEIDILGHPIGKQDQYIVAFGGINYIQFNQDESVFVDPIIFKNPCKTALSNKLMLFYTGIERVSSDILKEQKQNTPSNFNYLDIMVELAKKLRFNIVNNDLNKFGEILHEGWLNKIKLSSTITNQKIDEYYDKARKAGAIGGKILGAGGGGFLLFYCEEENQDGVRKALRGLKETPFKFEPQGSKIIYVSD